MVLLTVEISEDRKTIWPRSSMKSLRDTVGCGRGSEHHMGKAQAEDSGEGLLHPTKQLLGVTGG